MMIKGRYLFTNITFVIEILCQPQEQRTFVSTANEALVGTLMTRCDMNDIFPNGGVWVVTPGGALPINRLMDMCRWMGSHFHNWIDYNGIAFSTESPTELLEWGRKLNCRDFGGKKILVCGIKKYKDWH